MKMLRKRFRLVMGMLALVLLLFPGAGLTARAALADSDTVYVQMPGFVVEQWSTPRVLAVETLAYVRELPDKSLSGFASITKGEFVNVWGQTDTGWYFIEYGGQLGYVRCEAGDFASEEQLLQLQEAALLQQQEAAAALLQQAAGVVFIGDSRMVTLQEAVENNLGICPVTVIAKSGSRYEWFHDTAIPQADKIIGSGTKVLINMGVNDLSHADQYAQDVNYWAAVWSARGAQIFYASVNPVYANSYGITEERVSLFNTKLQSLLIPQVIWLDSNTYLKQSGVHSNDGLHYQDDTNLNLFYYYMTMIGAV